MTTKEYRKEQFGQLPVSHSPYKPKIKIIKDDGQTNWMDIEDVELQAIIELLS